MKHVNKAITDLNDIVNPCYEAQNPAFGPINIPFLVQLICQQRAKKILDVGTGEGSFLLHLAKQVPQTKFEAAETNEQLIKLAMQKKLKAKKCQINFVCCEFSESYPQNDFDMIMARFAVEHMTDIPAFLSTVRNKLKKGGCLAIIEYFISTAGIDDPVWLEFRKKELVLYKTIQSHAQISLQLPHLMREAGFKNITSSFEHVSPETVDKKAFFRLVSVYAETYAQIDSRIWPGVFVKKIKKWCDFGMRADSDMPDPVMFVTHTVGYK